MSTARSAPQVVRAAELGDFEECNRFARLLLFAAKQRDLGEVTRLLGGDGAPARSPGSREYPERSDGSRGHGVPFSEIASVRRVSGSMGEHYHTELLPSGLASPEQSDEGATRVATTLLHLISPVLDAARSRTGPPAASGNAGRPDGAAFALAPESVAAVRDTIIIVAQHCKRLTSQVGNPPFLRVFSSLNP